MCDESKPIEPTFYVAEGFRDWIVDYLKEQAGRPTLELDQAAEPS